MGTCRLRYTAIVTAAASTAVLTASPSTTNAIALHVKSVGTEWDGLVSC